MKTEKLSAGNSDSKHNLIKTWGNM
jgi:hypothetical protein